MTESRRIGRFGATLTRYVARELAFPTALSLAGLTVLVLTKDLLSFSDLVINRGFGAGAVALIAFYEIVPLVARTLPFAVLIGALAGLGRLRADLEILAIEAAGVSSRRLIVPVLAFAAAMTISGLLLSLSVAPWAIRSLEASLQQMVLANPGVVLRPGTVYEFGTVKVAAREVSARGDQLRGVLLWIPNLGQTIFAEQGLLEPLDDGSTRLSLQEVQTLLSPRGGGGVTRFETFSTTLQANSTPLQRDTDEIAGASMGRLAELARAVPDTGNLARQARVELHRRFSYPAAILAFGLLTVPLALSGRRFSQATGGVVGLLATVVYYGLMQLGEGLIQAGVVSVGVGVWLPNVLMGVLAATLLWRKRRGMMGNWKPARRESADEKKPRAKDRPARLPRYILPRYVARSYLQMLSLAFAVLLIGYLLVDVLERLQWLARYHAEALEVVRFYGARIPLLASRVVPMSLLLATALTVSLLSAHRELTAMRACGVAAGRALAPILLIAGVIMPGYFLLNEVVVPRTNALADHLKETEIKDRGNKGGLLHMMIWYRAGTYVYQAQELDPKLGEAQEVSIYELGEDGLPMSRTDARAAKHVGNGVWELVDPVRVEISDQGLRRMTADPHAQLGEVPGTTVDTMHLGLRQLAGQIRDAEVNGYDATTYRVDFHVQLAMPLSCVLLPAVALFFAIGGPPFPSPAVTLLVGGGLAVGYVLLTGVCASLGYGGFLPPVVAGWGPAAILAILASALALRSRG